MTATILGVSFLFLPVVGRGRGRRDVRLKCGSKVVFKAGAG